MKNRSNFLLTLFFSLLIIINIKLYPQEINYDIFQINLGTVAVPWAMNDSTEVVGVYQDGGGVYTAFHWAKGVFIPLSPGLDSQAKSINNNSEIVGRENDLAHYWSEDTTFSLLLPGTTYSSANGINNLGNIVGYSGATAFYYDGTMHALSNPSGYAGSLAEAINDLNTIVGHTADDSQTNNGAVRWQNGVPVLLDTSYRNAQANSVNNQNVTVGFFMNSGWGRAFMWVDNTVTVLPILPGYDDANCLPYDINDSNIIVGVCGGGPGVNRAWIWKDGVMDDLNNQIPPDSNITLNIAWSINNKGEIVCSGYTPGYVTHHYLLKPITIDITKPKQSDKWMAGETDTIRWTGGKANEVIKIKYSTDAGNNFELIDAGINATDTMYVWDIPDTLIGRRSLIRIERNSNSDILAVSDTFKIKPYIITRVDQNGDYVKYDINTDRWGFGNDSAVVWPDWWYARFNYQGTDPFTNKQYSRRQGDSIFVKAKSSDHPDWISFVKTFGIAACYADTYIGIYNPAALLKWKSVKGKWGGSCFGMAVSNALAFSYKNEFLNKYPNFPHFIIAHNVVPDTNVIPVINELFTHQYGNPHEANLGIALQKTPNQTLKELRDLLREDNVTVRTLSFLSNDPFDQGGHAIVGYKIKKDKNIDDRYYVYVYDNSNPDSLNAYVRIDTLVNGGNGSWYTPYAWQNWGGDKYLFLEDTASNFFANPVIPKKSKHISPFVLAENDLQILSSSGVNTMIIDEQGNQTGIGSSGMTINIPGSYPLIKRNGSSGPPYGYYLPTDNYSVVMNNFLADTLNTFFFTGNKSFEYERYGATNSQTDRLFFDGGVSVVNPDQQSKSIKLLDIINETTQEKLFVIRHLDLLQNDSVKIENIDNDKLKLTSYGSAKDYEIGLEYTSETNFGLFGRLNIQLSANTTHTFVPNWSDISNSDLEVYVDIANNGTIDDTLYLQNQVTSVEGEQGLLIPTEYRLEQNYPNPFNSSTVIRYSIPKEGIVSLKIYTAIGEEVTTIVNEVKQPGNYQVTFNTEQLPSGVYFYRLQAGGFVETKKMLLLK